MLTLGAFTNADVHLVVLVVVAPFDAEPKLHLEMSMR